MNRRTFFAAVAPIVTLAVPALSHAQLGAIEPPGAGVVKVPRTPAAVEPKPAEPKPGEPAKKAKGPMEILSREATLSNKINLAVFVGEVDVRDPEIHMTCDKLTVFMKPKKPKNENAAPAEPPPIGAEAAATPKKPKGEKPAEAAAEDDGGGKVEKAIAEGNVIIDLVQIDAEGNKKIYHGKAKHAVFDTKKNTCVLTGWPRISEDGDDGPQELVGQEESSVITLDRVEEKVWGDRCKTRLNGGSLNAPKKKPAR